MTEMAPFNIKDVTMLTDIYTEYICYSIHHCKLLQMM